MWHDVVGLKVAVNWATEHLTNSGEPLLASNPLAKLRVKQEPKPCRPVADDARYLKLKSVASELPVGFELALNLAWSTGHRIGAILGLGWEGVSFDSTEQAPHGSIRWRAEHDKLKTEHVTPLSSPAREALEQEREERPGIGAAWLFPSQHDSDKRLDRHLMTEWLRKAERKAGLKHIKGGGWNGFRRGWATLPKHFPLADVAEADGWKDTATLLKAYTHSNAKTVLAVVQT